VRAARRAGVPVLVRGDSQLGTPRAWWKRWVKELLYRRLLRQFNGFLVVGQRNREYLAHYGVTPEKMFFAPHFVDNDWFNQKAETLKNRKAEIRNGWGADDGTFVALFVGKFQAIKRPGDLLQALAQLKGRADLSVGQRATPGVPPMLAVFVGAGELEQTLRAEAAALGLRAHFAGFKNQSELPACYAAADVLVLPSESETWGLVVNEAMACGTPAIVSDVVGCAPDLVAEGKTGSVFPVGNVQALAACLEKLAQARTSPEQQIKFLVEKMATYSVATAVVGTVAAMRTLAEAARKGGR
jgi:glycosyltransferase involved in cell wall biosynthesis